jgi:hypothetical protein
MLSAVLRHKQLRDKSQNPNDPSDSPPITENRSPVSYSHRHYNMEAVNIHFFSAAHGSRGIPGSVGNPSETNGRQNAAGIIFQ